MRRRVMSAISLRWRFPYPRVFLCQMLWFFNRSYTYLQNSELAFTLHHLCYFVNTFSRSFRTCIDSHWSTPSAISNDEDFHIHWRFFMSNVSVFQWIVYLSTKRISSVHFTSFVIMLFCKYFLSVLSVEVGHFDGCEKIPTFPQLPKSPGIPEIPRNPH